MNGAVINWSSSNPGVAAVSQQGLVTAVRNGTAVVTARSGGATATVTVTVAQTAGSIVIEPDAATLVSFGATVQLTARVLDGNGQPVVGAEVAWESSDAEVAAVSARGLVTAVRNGTAVITARSGSAAANVEITVRIPSPDREVLIALYHATGGPGWTNSTNWLSSEHVGEWYGVTTDGEGRVTGLNLGSNGLQGPLPPELVQLNGLRGLSLENNQLSGSVMAELGRLGALTHLYLFGNLLTGAIPPELGQLENLIHLCLNSNNLTGSIPSELGGMKNLRWLHLQENTNLSGQIPLPLTILDLDALQLQGTRVCINDDPVLKSWVSGITDARVADCEGFDLERIALEALYHTTNGSNWNRDENWLSDAPLADWFGVETDESGRVVSLKLIGNGLTGHIPPELAQLSSLTRLGLGFNELTGQIPTQLGSLSNLAVLNLASNHMAGNIPVELGKLANLEELRLDSNSLSGEIPAELARLSNLRELYLSDNHLSGGIPVELGQLERLTLLWLASNRLEGEIPEELGQLSNLGELRLGINSLTGGIPAELGQLRSLKALSLSGNQLSGEIPVELGNLTNLTELILEANQLTGSIPAELGQLTSLKDLKLNSNHLTGNIPAEIGQLANLGRLILHRNRLTGRIPAELGELPTLWGLFLTDNFLTGPIPVELAKSSNLKYLYLGENESLKGPLPRALLTIPLHELDIGGTQLCLPVDAEFQSWLMDIQKALGVKHCDRKLVTVDKNALIALYHATGGPNWENNEHWLSNQSIGQWFGVTTNDAGRVEQLSLENNNLDGTLPAELGRLTDLRGLRIDGNLRLLGSLPRELTGLFMDTLQLNGTQLCVPTVVAFQTWIEQIAHKSGVVNCDENTTTRDKTALEELFHMTGGQYWTNNTNWLSDAPLDDWYGVTTDAEGRITILDLSRNGLAGTLPAELGELTHLTSLSFSENKLSGAIPVELANLSNLADLDLGYNQMSGGIPSELGRLSKLVFLDLTGNQLIGIIPGELGQLTELYRLRLGENRLTGEIPAELGDVVNLRILALYKNQLTGGIPPELGQLAHLEEYFLHDNRLEGNIPAELGRLSKLRWMYLFNNQLTGSIPGELGRLSDLSILDAGHNRLTGELPAEFGNLENLKTLRLNNNSGMHGPLPLTLTQLELNTLFLDNTQFCAPNDPAFQLWFQDIESHGDIATCLPAMNPKVYLTQTVQSFKRPVPLVEGKAALLRVFFETEEAVLSRPPVRAALYLDDHLVHDVVIPAGPVKIPIEIDEGSIEQSANALVPASVVKPGLQLVVDMGDDGVPGPGLDIVDRVPETGRMDYDVRSVPDFNLTLVPLLWMENPEFEVVTRTEDLGPNDDLFRLTRDLLPIKEFQLDIHDPVYTSFRPVLDYGTQILSEIEALRVLEGKPGHFMGIWVETGFGVAKMRGLSSVASLEGSIMAHELGHNMSLGHAPCGVAPNPDRLFPNADGSIGAWGYDHLSGELRHPSSPDIMSYCLQNVWISDYHFKKAVDYRTYEEEAMLYSALSAPTKSLLLWGALSKGGDLALEPSFVAEAPPVLPQGDGPYRLAGEDVDGRILFTLDFDMSEIADGDGDRSFAFAVPVSSNWRDRLVRISLSGPEGYVEMARDGGRSTVLLRNQSDGQVRGFMRGWPETGATVRGARRVLPEPGLDVMVSPGIPNPADW